MNTSTIPKTWDLQLSTMPDFRRAMERIYAWYDGAMIDRVPVRFYAHNTFVTTHVAPRPWKNLKERWFDHEWVLDDFIARLNSQSFLGETFPVFFPNLGPNVYAAFYGSHLEFGEDTSWAEATIRDWADLAKVAFAENEYREKITALTAHALERAKGKFMVGYTDLHPGMDCLAAWRDTQELLIDLYDEPGQVAQAAALAGRDFHRIFDEYDSILKQHHQLSVTWMGIPSYGKMHIPSCDFSAMISQDQFREFCLPGILDEMKGMDHNIFHLDGRGVAKHLETLLEIPQIDAIQWVQGVNEDKEIAQWIPMIRRIQEKGKSVVLNVERHEIALLMDELRPEGILVCVPGNGAEEQRSILDQIAKWV